MPNPPRQDWTVGDLIDFELLTREDSESEESDALQKRNRAIYLEIERNHSKKHPDACVPTDRRFLFHCWLDSRRRALYGRSEGVGVEIHSLLKFLALVFFFLGVVFAYSCVQGFFAAENGRPGEAAPGNVLWFFGVCIIIPLLLSLYGVWVALGRRLPITLPTLPPLLRGFVFRLVAPFLRPLITRAVGRVGTKAQLKTRATMGDLRAIATSRKGVVSAYFLIWIQVLGIGYAVALPSVLFWRNATKSQDFGWETNFKQTITPERIHQVARLAAIPWSGWKGAGEGYPSLEQVRKTEHTKYAPASAAAANIWGVWGTFLFCSSVAYVTLPRLAIFFASRSALRHRLRSETFQDARFDDLEESLIQPDASWKGDDYGEPNEAPIDAPAQIANQDSGPVRISKSCIIAISEDLISDGLQTAVVEFLRTRKQWDHQGTLTVPEDKEGQDQFLAELAGVVSQGRAARLVFVEDAMAPPVRERMGFLKAVREHIGPDPGIVVALLGEVSGDALGEPPRAVNFDVWRQKVRALGDPNSRVIDFHSAHS
ncbi:DUF2868 domain-containing protein [Haloferula sp.]|uniref:DUF2868 domain-containing protein n=1 Tax=Haloferula sp. TaxID=2497595 RepID=UPI0032A0A1DD